MGLFSFFRKNQQESSAGKSDFYSQADEDIPTGRGKRRQNKRDEPVDPVLPEKKRARRRLVGAIALVLAVVIVLPMILDSEPKPLADDINIQIPSRDTPSPVAAKPDSASNTEASLPVAPPEEEVIEPAKAQTPTIDPKVEAPKAETPKPEHTPVAEQNPHAATKPDASTSHSKPAVQPPAVDKSDKSAEATRARAILEGKPTTAAPKTSGKVAIQVAALASQDKVNELQKKLQGAGLKSYTQKVATASGDRIRVRVGPFANEAEAEKARTKLTKLGLTGKLIPA
ncbi:MAG TPA: SPOR domain-containing protein [Oxalicibacterium sp.]|uniref:SPOR domain-containing protein n=1 Tax=Oxalicibacterium sp. TaxID=2766525 RepID=UPI002C3E8844|nr:SPOR domain-containing protein [Oxalicibacterium sp.]HWU97678.1 SPOR domain-containing protein [Oxalicibacterium sp.]